MRVHRVCHPSSVIGHLDMIDPFAHLSTPSLSMLKRIAPAILGLFCCLASLANPAAARQVIRHPNPSASLAERHEWAMNQGRQAARDGYWVGYSIDKLMRERSFIGSYNSARWNRGRSLYAVLGEPEKAELMTEGLGGNLTIQGNQVFHGKENHEEHRLLLKEIGILLKYENGSARPSDMIVSNLSLEVDLEGRPLYWLGDAGQEASIEHLTTLYPGVGDEDVREDLLVGIGIHEAKEPVLDFMKEVLDAEKNEDLQEAAVFWIGQQDHPYGLKMLEEVVASRRPLDVREHAVFSISQMSMPEAVDVLIDLARNEPNLEIRKKAIFWLGQKASRRAVETLEDVLADEADVEVQKHAVFALSQLPADEAVPRLIDIARHHESVDVRKQAIFWLGDSGDPRAIDFLVEIVKTGKVGGM